jgi:hypothetical protein
MIESQASVLQEGESQGGRAPDARAAGAHRRAQSLDVRGAEIGQFARLEIAPEQFNGVEVWGVGRKAFDLQPRPLRAEVGPHAPTFVGAQAIPDEHDPLPAEVPLQGAEEGDERRVGIGARAGLKVQAGAPPVPPKPEGGGDGQPLPVRPGMVEHRRLAPRRPGASHDGVLRDPAFVLEDYPAPLAPRVFFTWGQRCRRQRRMAASSRSRAWRAGRCSDQCKPCRSRQTCAG